MKPQIKNRMAAVCLAATLTVPCLLVGCDKEVSHTESDKVSSDGTVKSKEKTVTRSTDGTVTTTTEESKKTTN